MNDKKNCFDEIWKDDKSKKDDCCCIEGLVRALRLLKRLNETEGIMISNIFFEGIQNLTQNVEEIISVTCDITTVEEQSGRIVHVSNCSIYDVRFTVSQGSDLVEGAIRAAYPRIPSNICDDDCRCDCCCKKSIIKLLATFKRNNEEVDLDLDQVSNNPIRGEILGLDEDVVWIQESTNSFVLASICRIATISDEPPAPEN